MKRVSLVVIISLVLATSALAQTPSAPAGQAVRVAVIDYNRAVTETVEGKKAAERITAAMAEKQAEFEKEQKNLEELENQSRTQSSALSAAALSDLNRKITDSQTNLNRINEDAQRLYLQLQETHFGPIAQTVSRVIESYCQETGTAVVFDLGSEGGNIVYWNPVADITTEIIRRADAGASTTAPSSPAPAATPGSGTAPTTPSNP